MPAPVAGKVFAVLALPHPVTALAERFVAVPAPHHLVAIVAGTESANALEAAFVALVAERGAAAGARPDAGAA